ncbi:MAG: RagB/SusD family nutrient uptake outer membrane protein [Bacteroidetes bacterium]|nr:RagB/SusD family nutrient uptake outer membrane protein [Bacteroidota bacterium]
MKKIKLFIFILPLVLIGVSCSDFLDRKPLSIATEGDLTVGGVEGKVFGLYGTLRDEGMSGLPMVFMHVMRSDDAIKGSTATDGASYEQMADYFKYNKSDGWLLLDYWNAHYKLIYACNDILHDIDSLKLNTEGDMINLAEAKFFRAYAYFDLVRTFGEVPKIDFKIYSIGNANIEKSTVADLYTFIDKDLTDAVAYLPSTWISTYLGRATKGAANTLWAKTKLYRKDWGGALAKAEEVISSGNYSLLASYDNFFKEEGENSSESILEVQMYVSSNGSVSYNNNCNGAQGIRGSGDWDLGWGWNVPSQDLVDSYEAGDPRKTTTILYSGGSDGYGLTVPATLGNIQPYWNRKVYSNPARRAATGIKYANWLNIRLLRYADVLLMAAEAANEIGGEANTTKALKYLEMIRARARGTANVLPAVTTTVQSELRTAIKRERRAEFAMEYERFFDLVRWDDAITVLGPAGYTDKCKYYPIPQSIIDKAQGKLTQNPDWN